MLGVDPDPERTERTVQLPDEHPLLLCADGLVERRGTDLDEGIAALRDALSDLGNRDPRRPVRHPADPRGRRRQDDVVLVAVRGFTEDRPRPPEAGPNRTSADQSDA